MTMSSPGNFLLNYSLDGNTHSGNKLACLYYTNHVRYLSHLALQVGSSNWVHKTQIHSIQRWRWHQNYPICFPLGKQLHPFLYWIRYSWSRSTIILYYINLSVSWNTLLRNQISLCQHVFYYTFVLLHNLGKRYHQVLKIAPCEIYNCCTILTYGSAVIRGRVCLHKHSCKARWW